MAELLERANSEPTLRRYPQPVLRWSEARSAIAAGAGAFAGSGGRTSRYRHGCQHPGRESSGCFVVSAMSWAGVLFIAHDLSVVPTSQSPVAVITSARSSSPLTHPTCTADRRIPTQRHVVGCAHSGPSDRRDRRPHRAGRRPTHPYGPPSGCRSHTLLAERKRCAPRWNPRCSISPQVTASVPLQLWS